MREWRRTSIACTSTTKKNLNSELKKFNRTSMPISIEGKVFVDGNWLYRKFNVAIVTAPVFHALMDTPRGYAYLRCAESSLTFYETTRYSIAETHVKEQSKWQIVSNLPQFLLYLRKIEVFLWRACSHQEEIQNVKWEKRKEE